MNSEPVRGSGFHKTEMYLVALSEHFLHELIQALAVFRF
jgi:hypothetical protein